MFFISLSDFGSVIFGIAERIGEHPAALVDLSAVALVNAAAAGVDQLVRPVALRRIKQDRLVVGRARRHALDVDRRAGIETGELLGGDIEFSGATKVVADSDRLEKIFDNDTIIYNMFSKYFRKTIASSIAKDDSSGDNGICYENWKKND